jgi:exoribonuclease R
MYKELHTPWSLTHTHTHTHREGLRAGSDNLNKRHRNAQMAGRASVELHTLIFFKDRTVLADARVTKVRAVLCLWLCCFAA